MAGTKSLKDYLKKYESNSNEEEKKKKKKKKKKMMKKTDSTHAAGVLIVDEDPVWQKPVNLEEEDDGNDSAGKRTQLLLSFLFLIFN